MLRAGGVYEQMSQEDKQKYLDGFGGNEANARAFWENMKNPPTSSGMPMGINPKN